MTLPRARTIEEKSYDTTGASWLLARYRECISLKMTSAMDYSLTFYLAILEGIKIEETQL